jgi:hypothetical protein
LSQLFKEIVFSRHSMLNTFALKFLNFICSTFLSNMLFAVSLMLCPLITIQLLDSIVVLIILKAKISLVVSNLIDLAVVKGQLRTDV